MLLSEFIKAHRKVESLEKALAQQQQQIEALTQRLEKVGALLEVSAKLSRVVASEE
jgi:hypothetical protein